MTKKGCLKGDECSFLHTDDNVRSSENEENTERKREKKRKECHFYKTEEGCRRGEACPFSHSPENEEETRWLSYGDCQKNDWQGMQKQLHSLNSNATKFMDEMTKLNQQMIKATAAKKNGKPGEGRSSKMF